MDGCSPESWLDATNTKTIILAAIAALGTLLFPRHSEKRFPVARIITGPDILPERRDYSIIFPYGWEKKQLTHEMRQMFPRKTGLCTLIMLDELHQFFDSREKQ